jgi:hypothetical protein
MEPYTPTRRATRLTAPPPVVPLASGSIGNPACAPLHFTSSITAANTPAIAFLFNTNEAPPKKLTRSKTARNHFLFNTFARFFLRHPSPQTPRAAIMNSRQRVKGRSSFFSNRRRSPPPSLPPPLSPAPPPFLFSFCAARPNLIASDPNIENRRK